MTDQQALFRGILAAPDDDAPRLVYADWLDENDQSRRAEYIRAACALARAEERSPTHRKLLTQTQKLFDQKWELPIQGKVLHRIFARGFVDQVTIFSKRLVELHEELSALEPIRTIKLGNINAARGNVPVAQLAAVPMLSRLRGLDLSLCSDAPTLLQDLNVRRQLAPLRELTYCSDDLQPSKLIKSLMDVGLNQLETLRFAGRSRAGNDDNDLPHIPWTAATFKRMADWPSVQTLRRLEIPDAAWTPASSAALAAVPFKQLECLNLQSHVYEYSGEGRAGIGDAGLKAIAAAPHLATLKELQVPAHNITARGVAALAASPHMKNLRRLVLSNNEIGQQGLESLLQSPHVTGLYYLEANFVGVIEKDCPRAAFKKKYPEAELQLFCFDE